MQCQVSLVPQLRITYSPTNMSDILDVINKLTTRLWAQYGNPLAKYKKSQADIHMTYYVGELMKQQGHKYVPPARILGEHEDRVYYSEAALHDAFLAGQLLAKADTVKMRQEILADVKQHMIHSLDEI